MNKKNKMQIRDKNKRFAIQICLPIKRKERETLIKYCLQQRFKKICASFQRAQFLKMTSTCISKNY